LMLEELFGEFAHSKADNNQNKDEL
jgi:hypothetical protein